jgi:RNA polymerase sigma factor (sigma-70 family)
LENSKARFHSRLFLNKLYDYVKQTYIEIKIKSKMQYGRNRVIKLIPRRTTSEKSDEDVQRYKPIRKAKFVPFSRGEFGFFTVAAEVALYSVGCRSPPLFLILIIFQNSETEEKIMSDNKNYFLRVENELVSVDKDTYIDHYKAKRREKYQKENDLAHGVVSYNTMDTVEINGEEIIPDTSESIEDVIMTKMMIEKLCERLDMLSADELWLIHNLFYMEKTERQIADNLGCSQPIIHKRKVNVLKKLKKLLEN